MKKLLLLKNHEYWKESSNLVDVYRHCKYTIRKIARFMANLETYSIFKRLKEPNFENHTVKITAMQISFSSTLKFLTRKIAERGSRVAMPMGTAKLFMALAAEIQLHGMKLRMFR